MSSTMDAVASATASLVESASASASSTANSSDSQPASYKVIGILLAVGSGLLIGSSFILKKKGLLSCAKQEGHVAGEGQPYLKSPLWWTGMIIMIIGEICNLVAYSFADAILVTPMGSIAVVTSGALAHFILKERLTLIGWVASALCVLGSIIIALNGPSEATSDIKTFMKLFIGPGFLVWLALSLLGSVAIIFFVAPRWGKTHMLVYIGICSLLGGLSVACTSGLGAAILAGIRGDSSVWKNWFLYFLLAFCVVTLVSEVIYLNKALELFNTAMVTPVYFVTFTSCSLISSIILHKGFSGSTTAEIVTLILGFFVICLGVTLLQLSKIDPEEIKENVLLDRRTTMLLSASRAAASGHDGDHEKGYDAEVDVGIDTVRGAAGVIGSVRRAISMRRSMSTMGGGPGSRQNSRAFGDDEMQMRRRGRNGAPGAFGSGPADAEMGYGAGGARQSEVPRFQLYDEPMPVDATDKISMHSGLASPGLASPGFDGRSRSSTLQFATTDNVHRYAPGGGRDAPSQHLERPLHDGAHQHRDISSQHLPTSPLSAVDFSPARSGSVFSTSAYLDPYSESEGGEQTPTPQSGFHSNTVPFPSSPNSQTFPRRHQPSRSSSGQSLADRLGSTFAASTPDVSSQDFADSDLPAADRTRGVSAATLPSSATRRFFGAKEASHPHRVPHPKGPRDLEAQESQALVGEEGDGEDGLHRRNESASTSASGSDDEGGGAHFSRVETYDSQTAL